MKVRPAAFFPLCVLALAGAFGAGYAVRGKADAGHGNEAVETEGARISNIRAVSGGSTDGRPFPKGRADDWLRQIDDLTTNLSGQRLKVYAALQCGHLDQAAAEELLKRCDYYQSILWGCGSGEWNPGSELLDELRKDTLIRLSDLDPDRAFELFVSLEAGGNDEECAAIVLRPLVSRDPAKVAEFLGNFGGNREELLRQLVRSTDMGDHLESFLTFIPACREDADALGVLLEFLAGRDRNAAFEMIASEVSKPGGSPNYDFSNGLAEMSFSERLAFAEWSSNYAGSETGIVQGCALERLIPDAGHSTDLKQVASLFEKLIPGQPPEDREGLATQLGSRLAEGNLNGAVEWLENLADEGMRETVLKGICRARLDELAKDPEESLGEENRQPGYWIAKVESAGERDALTVEYVRTLERGGRAEADQWAESISDPALKQATKQMLAQGREVKRLQQQMQQ